MKVSSLIEKIIFNWKLILIIWHDHMNKGVTWITHHQEVSYQFQLHIAEQLLQVAASYWIGWWSSGINICSFLFRGIAFCRIRGGEDVWISDEAQLFLTGGEEEWQGGVSSEF